MDVVRALRILMAASITLSVATCGDGPAADGMDGLRDVDRHAGDAVVIVQDLEGQPIAGASVWFKDADSEDYINGHEVVTAADGMASSRDRSYPSPPFNTNDEGFDIVACHPGYRSAVLKRFAGVTTVRLPKSSPTRVRVHITEDSVLPEPPHRLDVRLDWWDADGEDDPRRFDPLPVAQRTSPDVLEFQVDDPGTYVVFASRSVRTGDIWPEAPDPDSRAMNFVVTDPEFPTVSVYYGEPTEEIELRIVEPRQFAAPDED